MHEVRTSNFGKYPFKKHVLLKMTGQKKKWENEDNDEGGSGWRESRMGGLKGCDVGEAGEARAKNGYVGGGNIGKNAGEQEHR